MYVHVDSLRLLALRLKTVDSGVEFSGNEKLASLWGSGREGAGKVV